MKNEKGEKRYNDQPLICVLMSRRDYLFVENDKGFQFCPVGATLGKRIYKRI